MTIQGIYKLGREGDLTCCKHQIWLDHFNCVGAELLKIWNASRVMKSADVNVGHLEAVI